MSLSDRIGAVTGRLTSAGEELSTTCWVCATSYRPRLTAGQCPVCGRAADGVRPEALPHRLDPDTRSMLLVVAAMAANLLILAVLAGMYLTQ